MFPRGRAVHGLPHLREHVLEGRLLIRRPRHASTRYEPLGKLTIAKQWDTKKQKISPLETAKRGIVMREMPVHSLLARILAEWKLHGCAHRAIVNTWIGPS